MNIRLKRKVKNHKEGKTLIFSYWFPPVCNAASAVIRSLVKYFPRDEFYILRGNPKRRGLITEEKWGIDCDSYFFDMPNIFRKKNFKIGLPVYLEHLWIPIIVLKGLVLTRIKKTRNIFSMYPTHYFLIASYLIHKFTGLPMIIYMVDLYSDGRTNKFERLIANLFEKKILCSASKIFFMTEFLQEHYFNKYSISGEVLPLPTDLTPEFSNSIKNNKKENEINIVFTGSIYSAQLDAIVNLVKAVELLKNENIMITLITRKPPEYLADFGIKGDNISIFPAKRSEVLVYQKKADILFLPLAFNSDSLITKVSLPSKVLEYFVAGKPILVHAPDQSFLVSYTKKKKFGLVVDKPDINELKKAILLLINDSQLCKNLIENAQKTLLEHNAKTLSLRLQNYLKKY